MAGDLGVRCCLVRRGRLTALAHGVEQVWRRDQIEPDGGRHGYEDRFRGADRGAGVSGPDFVDEVVVLLERGVHDYFVTLGEVRHVRWVDPRIVGGDPVDHGMYVGRRVPAMRVTTLRNADQMADVK